MTASEDIRQRIEREIPGIVEGIANQLRECVVEEQKENRPTSFLSIHLSTNYSGVMENLNLLRRVTTGLDIGGARFAITEEGRKLYSQLAEEGFYNRKLI